MFLRIVSIAAIAVGFGFIAGCGPAKLNVEKSLNLGESPAQSIDLDPQPKPQKITVDFSSSAADVSVYVFKSEDVKDDDSLVMASPKLALASKSGKAGTFTVDVPENTAVRVVVRSAQKTTVHLKLTN